MFKINKLRVEILTDKSENIDDLYGFEFSFEQGLNIIAGENSRGKTTINSCIYYALGMEELLGGHNEKALDKALKEQFVIKDDEIDDDEIGENFTVSRSKILLEIENENNEIVCLERIIKGTNNDEKTSNITVSQTNIIDYNSSETIEKDVFYVNGRGNNDDPNGFYDWFADFINIKVPLVSNSSIKSNYSPLYLQSIFSATFIEQTKGWSDFFATMPYFGITKAKEKVVEFLLDLEEINISTKRDVLIKERNYIEDEWNKKIKAFSFLEKQNNSTTLNLPEQITVDKSVINKITAVFHVDEDIIVDYKQNLENLLEAISTLESKPISTIDNNREETIFEFEKTKAEYVELKQYIKRFEDKFNIERQQLVNLRSQFNNIEIEIKEHTNLIKAYNQNIFKKNKDNRCPTCTQSVTTELLSSHNINIPQLSLEENKSFLKSQQNIIKSSIESLNKTLEEKSTLLGYFKNTLRNKETLIKSLSKDLIADGRALSETEIVRKIQLEQQVENLQQYEEALIELKDELIVLANKYHNNSVKIGNLETSDDNTKLENFEADYKKLLYSFGYDSNGKNRISINRKEPFKYFPVYKAYDDIKTPQSIRTNSSASDFVRNIWAYTLSLRNEGLNHPGVIIFDEPGQHRTKLSSLKALFKASTKVNDKQTIIFTSIDNKLNDDEDIDLNVLIEDLVSDDYQLIRLDNSHKVIKKLFDF
ncbi:hypothetical protein [Myroides odoratimimus]|nr:hypothetical protein [Myroides odoratimimus]MDM1086664.1 hypothetical protein [Myroides odoratimimus]MDM1512978.1 hypothetical protein [Myroides odoratimimus]